MHGISLLPREILDKGVAYLRFVVRSFKKISWQDMVLFLHEHPCSSWTWEVDCARVERRFYKLRRPVPFCSGCVLSALMWFWSGLRCFCMQVTSSRPTPRARDKACIGRGVSHSGPEFLLAPFVPEVSCTSPRRHGKITHTPEEAPKGGFGPHLPYYPPRPAFKSAN